MTRHHRPTALHLAAVLALLSATTNLPGQMFVPGVAAIEDLEAEDVPPECVQVCAPIVQLTARCEAQVKAQFGTDKRDLSTRQHQDISETRDVEETTLRRLSGRRRRRRDLQRMLGRRLSSRQEPESDGDSSDEEEETASLTPGSGLVAAPTLGVGRSASESAAKEAAEAAAENASRACVCGERGFDVAGAAFGCLSCVSRNVTAVEANEDIREIIGECGFVAAPAAPAPPVTTSTTTTSSPPIVPPPVLNPAVTTTLPANLAPIQPFPSSSTPSSSSSIPLPPASVIPPAIQTSSSTTPPPPTFPPAEQTSSLSTPPPPPPSVPPVNVASSTPSSESITPVTVFVPPNFQTLPSIVPPNDFRDAPALPDANGNQMSGAKGGFGVLRLWGVGSVWAVVLAFTLLG